MKHSGTFISVLLIVLLGACNSVQKKSGSEDDGFTFAFLTDIHVEYGKNADKGFQQAIEHVNSLSPEFVITGGDLVSDVLAQTEEGANDLYDLYIEKAKGFEMPLYNTLGNHEEFGIYERSGVAREHELYGDKMFEARLGKRFYSFDHKGWRFYILDSVEETEDRQYYGYIDSIQITWLKEELKKADEAMPMVIVSHIPFITAIAQVRGGSMNPNNRGLVVENSKEVLDLFENYNLKLVLQGHLHVLEDVYTNGIHFLTGGAVSARWWNGPNGDMQEGYLLLHVKGDDLSWEYVDFGWEV